MPKNRSPQNLKLALRANSGLNLGSVYPLAAERNVIGRNIEASVPLDDAKVSRTHASIDLQNGFYYLVDLGSINGTFLNGRQVEHAEPISVGDELRVGSSVLKVQLLDDAKEHAGRQWRDSTRAIMRAPEVVAAPVHAYDAGTSLLRKLEATGARWRTLIPTLKPQDDANTVFRRRWILIGVCLVIVAAALITQLGPTK